MSKSVKKYSNPYWNIFFTRDKFGLLLLNSTFQKSIKSQKYNETYVFRKFLTISK